MFLKLHDVSVPQLEVMFSFAGTAQEAGAGGRSGAAGIPAKENIT